MKPWIDLAEICDRHDSVRGFENEKTYPKSCWFCAHYGRWGDNDLWSDSTEWQCEFRQKEIERKMRETIRYEGQQVLIVK